MEEKQTRSFGAVLWRRKWIILVVVVLAVGANVAVSTVRTPQYQSRAVMVKESGGIDVALLGAALYAYQDVQRDLVTTAQAIMSERVAALVIEDLGLSESPQQVLECISASPSADSNTIDVRALYPDPEQAALIANSFCNQAILLKQEANRAALVAARQAAESQYAQLTPTERESTRGVDLQTRVEQFRLLEEVETGGYSLWQPATATEVPVSPKPVRDTAAALAVGIVLGLVFAVGVDRTDKRLKEYSDFEREYGLPVLALIPHVGKRWRNRDETSGVVGFVNNSSTSLEAYRLLRSNLQYVELGKGLRTILITSGLPQESKTVTTINLALSLALSGARVVLVDTDLRNPLMHRYLGLDNTVGLSSVLAGTTTVDQAIKGVNTADFLPSRGRDMLMSGDQESHLHKNLLCLTSGPTPPNPAELLASPKMGEIIKNLGSLADQVLIDSAPVLLVADALSIAPRVDGVIVVSRAKATTVDNAREVRNTLERVGARMVGIVIAGVKMSSNRGYQRGYYQKQDV